MLHQQQPARAGGSFGHGLLEELALAFAMGTNGRLGSGAGAGGGGEGGRGWRGQGQGVPELGGSVLVELVNKAVEHCSSTVDGVFKS